MSFVQIIQSLSCSRFEDYAEEYLKAEYPRIKVGFETVWTHYFVAVARWWPDGEPDNDNWLIGGDCPFMSVRGDAADNHIEAVAIYAHELKRWALKTGYGRRDTRIVREIGTWKPIVALSEEYLQWFSTREVYLTWHFVPANEQMIHRTDIREAYEQAGVLTPTMSGESDKTL